MKDVGTRGFDKEVLKSPEPVVVLFLTSWCAWCRRFRPRFAAWAKRMKVKAVEAVLDDDRNPLWEKWDINVVPTVLLFSGRKVVHREDGKLYHGLDQHNLARLGAALAKLK